MNIRMKAVMAAMLAALVLSLGVGSASALRSLLIDGPTTLVLNAHVVFNANDGSGAEVNCNATITKTVSRVIPKIDHILIGKITRIDIERTIPSATCGASVGRLQDIRFLNLEREEVGRILKGTILGTLPNITGILLLVGPLIWMLKTDITGECEYESEEAGRRPEIPTLASVSRGVIGNLRFEAPNENRLIRGGFLCSRRGELAGEMRPLQSTRVILI